MTLNFDIKVYVKVTVLSLDNNIYKSLMFFLHAYWGTNLPHSGTKGQRDVKVMIDEMEDTMFNPGLILTRKPVSFPRNFFPFSTSRIWHKQIFVFSRPAKGNTLRNISPSP